MDTECSIPYNEVIFDLATDSVKWCCKHDLSGTISGFEPRRYFDHPILREIRTALGDGVRHPACRLCWQAEDRGITSWRMSNQLQPHAGSGSRPDERRVSRMEVKLDTTCDMACIYCSPWYSNTWEKENDATGFYKMPRRADGSGDMGKVIDCLEEIGRYNRDLSIDFTGGEPFLSRHFTEDNLSRLIDAYHIHNSGEARMVLKFASNVNTPPKVLDKVRGCLQRLKESHGGISMHLAMSLESTGRYTEMSRYLSNWDTMDANIRSWLSTEWITPMISSSFNALVIPDMANFVRYIIDVFGASGRTPHVSPNIVHRPEGLSPSVLPPSFGRHLEETLSVIDSSVYWNDLQGLRDTVENMLSTMGTNSHRKIELKRYTDYCINQRHIDLGSINPELYEYLYAT